MNIRNLRFEAGLSQTQLANKLGISQQMVSFIECGNHRHTRAYRLAYKYFFKIIRQEEQLIVQRQHVRSYFNLSFLTIVCLFLMSNLTSTFVYYLFLAFLLALGYAFTNLALRIVLR